MKLTKDSENRDAFVLGILILLFSLAFFAASCGGDPAPPAEPVRSVSTPDTTNLTNLVIETDLTVGDDLIIGDDSEVGGDLTVAGDLSVSLGGSLDMNENDLILDTDGDTILDNNGTDDTARLRLGDSSTGTFTINTGNLRVGNGTPTNAQDGEDAYIEGRFETGGAIFADMGSDAVAITAQGFTTQTNNLLVLEQSNAADVFSVGPSGATLVDLKDDVAGLTVQGHSSQTANLITAEASDGTDAFVVSPAGLTYSRVDTIAKTSSYTVTVAETGSLFTNAGASAEITLTLPAASEGLNYCVYVYAAYTVTLELDGADQIHHLTNAAGDRLQNTGTAGDSLCIVAADATYWLPLHEIGTWSDAN